MSKVSQIDRNDDVALDLDNVTNRLGRITPLSQKVGGDKTLLRAKLAGDKREFYIVAAGWRSVNGFKFTR
mgnify:CR=1 FL=1